MTIANVTAGSLIDPAWGNAVADQLNDLPEIIQHGVEATTTSATGQITVTFGTTMANTSYTAIAICLETNSSIQTTAQLQNRNTTDATFRILSDGARDDSVSRTIHWMIMGTPA